MTPEAGTMLVTSVEIQDEVCELGDRKTPEGEAPWVDKLIGRYKGGVGLDLPLLLLLDGSLR